jgi:hypothetical protein
MPDRSVTIKYRVGFSDFKEGEAALGRALGVPVDAPHIGGRILATLVSLFPNTVTINDAGVRQVGATRDWSEFGLAYETDNLLCLVFTANAGALTLPKGAMTPAQLATVRELIEEHLEPSPEKTSRILATRQGRAPSS